MDIFDILGPIMVGLRETALGGLAATPTGRAVKERMARQ